MSMLKQDNQTTLTVHKIFSFFFCNAITVPRNLTAEGVIEKNDIIQKSTIIRDNFRAYVMKISVATGASIEMRAKTVRSPAERTVF